MKNFQMFFFFALTGLLLVDVGCARTRMVPPNNYLMTCGDATIVVAQAEFKHAFDLEYRIETDAEYLCMPSLHSDDFAIRLQPIELRETESTFSSLAFQTVSAAAVRNPLGASIDRRHFLTDGLHGNVPAGRYVLELLYRPGKCHANDRKVCIARSQEFDLIEGIDFGLER